MSEHGESLSSVTPDKQRIPCNNKGKKDSENSITRKIIFKNQTTQVRGQKRLLYLM